MKTRFIWDIQYNFKKQIKTLLLYLIFIFTIKMHNPPANQRGVISSVGMESSFLAIRQDGEPIVHTQGTGVVLVYVWRWSSHIEIPGRRPIRSGLGIVV